MKVRKQHVCACFGIAYPEKCKIQNVGTKETEAASRCATPEMFVFWISWWSSAPEVTPPNPTYLSPCSCSGVPPVSISTVSPRADEARQMGTTALFLFLQIRIYVGVTPGEKSHCKQGGLVLLLALLFPFFSHACLSLGWHRCVQIQMGDASWNYMEGGRVTFSRSP